MPAPTPQVYAAMPAAPHRLRRSIPLFADEARRERVHHENARRPLSDKPGHRGIHPLRGHSAIFCALS
ncbi:MAG: hypothetical protein KAY46_00385 [Burkholderiaceae bacterium]|nr:hypothetical protein [Burkholderiaceae bacterium]